MAITFTRRFPLRLLTFFEFKWYTWVTDYALKYQVFILLGYALKIGGLSN